MKGWREEVGCYEESVKDGVWMSGEIGEKGDDRG